MTDDGLVERPGLMAGAIMGDGRAGVRMGMVAILGITGAHFMMSEQRIDDGCLDGFFFFVT